MWYNIEYRRKGVDELKLGQRIKERRQQLGLSVDEVAKALNKNRATVYRYESEEIENLPYTVLIPLAKVLRVTPAHILSWSSGKGDIEFLGVAATSMQYPFIDFPVAAGSPITIDGITDFSTISVPDYMLGKYSGRKDLLIMKVSGESMNNIIPNGSYIAVLLNYPISSLKDRDIVVFSKEFEYSVKRYFDAGDKIIFRPDSSDTSYSDIVVAKNEDLAIVGKVIMYSALIWSGIHI